MRYSVFRGTAMVRRFLTSIRYLFPLAVFATVTSPAWPILFYTFLPSNGAGQARFAPPRQINPADIAVPPGYCVEPVVTGLTYPTAVVTDDNDRVYLLESGYSYGEDFSVPQILRVEMNGQLAIVAKGDALAGPWTGMSYHQGAFYVCDGGEARGAGRLLQITLDGQITTLVDGLPSMGDHHANRPVIGGDGWVYFGVGAATNSGVVGPDNADFGWLKRFPQLHDIPPVDIVLTGQNFSSYDKETGQQKVTGAYVPYGVPTAAGQVIKGQLPCNGAILRTPLKGGGQLEWVAWGFRNPFGLTFGPDGSLYCTDNMYDERGCRPVYGAGDLLWRVQPGFWHGFPDYWGNIPLTHRRFAEKRNEQPVPQFLLANHPNIPPEPAARLGVRSSSDGFDFSRNDCFGHCGEAFIAVFGDIVHCGNGKVRKPVGCRVVRVDPCTGVINDFMVNKGKEAGPASKECNGGIERPVDCRFSRDGSLLYVVDFGVMTTETGKPTPYRETGVLWRVRRVACGEPCVSGLGGSGPAGYYRRGEAIGRPVPIVTDARARGQIVYMKHCYACHQGGEGGLGPALLQLAPGPIVRTQIRAGFGVMPGFSHDEIGLHEMNDLLASLRASRMAGPPYRLFR